MGEEINATALSNLPIRERPKSMIYQHKLRKNTFEFLEVLSVKESLNKISDNFHEFSVVHKPITSGIYDAVFFPILDKIIALSYLENLLSYDLKTGGIFEVSCMRKMNSLGRSNDESKLIALGNNEILLVSPSSLQVFLTIFFESPIKFCDFTENQFFITNLTEAFIVNYDSEEITPTELIFNNTFSIEYDSFSLILSADKEGLKTYSKTFEFLNFFQIFDVKFAKFSEDFENIISVGENEILIFSRDLLKLRTIYILKSVFDVVLQENLKVLAICNSEGEILVYDLRAEKRKISIPVHSSQLTRLFLRQNQLISLGSDTKISQIALPKLSNIYITQAPALAICISDSFSTVAYTTNSEVFFWNFKENTTTPVLKVLGLIPFILIHKNFIYVSSPTHLYEISLETNNSKSIEKSPDAKYTTMIICQDYLICGGSSQVIFLRNKSDLKESFQLLGHKDSVSCLSTFKKYLLSGSIDHTVIIWDLKDKTLKHILYYHTMKVTSIVADAGKVISAGDDRCIKICYIRTGNLIFSINNIIGSIRNLVSFGGEYLISCGSTGKIVYWNLNTYTEMVVNNPVSSAVGMAANEYIVTFTNGSAVYVMRNPLFYDKISAVGPDESKKYGFMKYCLKIIEEKSTDYDADMDKWLILPYFITPLHIYAYFNLSDNITSALNNNASLVQSRLSQSPLSIAVARDLESCVESILKSLRSQMHKNPHTLGFINNRSLIEMNVSNHNSLPKFYSLIFRDIPSEKLPKFIGFTLTLPLYAHSQAVIPNSQVLYHDKYIKDTGQPVVYSGSVVKLNLELGSEESLALLQSVVQCKNLEIFGTSFINAYVNDKWETVKWFMWIQFILYFSYLILLCAYMMHFYENKLFLMLPFSTSIMLTVYEVYKAMVSKREYLQDPWNYVDFSRALLFFIYAFGEFIGGRGGGSSSQSHKVDKTNNILLILTLLSFIRGVSYFRLFKSTRGFTFLLYQVLLDSRAFTIIMFYSTVAVAFLLYIVFKFEEDFSVYLGNSYLIDIQYLDPSLFNKTQWTVYALSLTINCLMMMSVLVSLYYNSIYLIMSRSEIDNCRALAFMSLEAERNMFWKRAKLKNSYLHMCEKEYSQEDTDPVLTKIKEVKNNFKDMQTQFAQVLEFRKDIGRILKENKKILNNLPRNKVSQTDKRKNSLVLLTLMFLAKNTENPLVKASAVKKILKIIKNLR